MICAERVVCSFFVEVDTIRAGVVEHAVQDDGYTLFLCLFDESFELLLVTKEFVYFKIVTCVIAVI